MMIHTVKRKATRWTGWFVSVCLIACLSLQTSCSEDDEAVDQEYPEWQSKNDGYFSQLVSEKQALSTSGSTSWEVVPAYTKPAQDYAYKYSDYIVIEKLESEGNTTSPYLTDTVEVHYEGRLLPSKSSPYGMIFDRSFSGTYDAEVSTPAKFAVKGMIDGFATALLHMHRGDHWKVYIPYQLGYGTTVSGSIPAYSTLIFDLRMEDFWSKKQGDRD